MLFYEKTYCGLTYWISSFLINHLLFAVQSCLLVAHVLARIVVLIGRSESNEFNQASKLQFLILECY